MNNPLKDPTVNPVEYVQTMFPGYRFVSIGAVMPFQYFIRGDEAKVEQALRSSPVIGKERIIVTAVGPAPEPLDDSPIEVDEVPETELSNYVDEAYVAGIVDGALESPDSDDSFDGEFADDFEDDEEDFEDEEYTDVEPTPETPSKPMNKSKLNAAVTAAFNLLLGAITKALKTTNVVLNLSPDNHTLSTITADGVVAASFRIQRFPGSDPLLLVSKFSIEETFRNSGFNRALHQVLDEAAVGAGAAGILATVREDNQLQNVILEFTGWSPIQGFTNPETGAAVNLYYKEVSA